jgi:hypothetical protein
VAPVTANFWHRHWQPWGTQALCRVGVAYSAIKSVACSFRPRSCGKIKTTFPKRQHSLIYIKDISAAQRLCERGEMLLPNMASGFGSNDT